MDSKRLFYCPHCGSTFLIISEKKLYCLCCRLTFSRTIIEKIAPETLLTDEELEAITNSLASLKTE
jgi:protein-arginine kinase activator protein McsA